MDFSFLSDTVGKKIRLERGGPDKLEGTLLAIMPDALAIETQNEGIVYVHGYHVKTLSETVVQEIEMPSATTPEGVVEPEEPRAPLIEAENFADVLTKLTHQMVRVNHGGPNSLQGVLIRCFPEAITILHEMKDYVHYPIHHIKSVTWIYQKRERAKDQGGKESRGK